MPSIEKMEREREREREKKSNTHTKKKGRKKAILSTKAVVHWYC